MMLTSGAASAGANMIGVREPVHAGGSIGRAVEKTATSNIHCMPYKKRYGMTVPSSAASNESNHEAVGDLSMIDARDTSMIDDIRVEDTGSGIWPNLEAGLGQSGITSTSAGVGVNMSVVRQFGGPNNDLPSYADLLASKALAVGDRVFYSERKGERFYGDLLPDGRIRYSAGQTPSLDDVYFVSPTAFHNFCGRIADPSYHKGNGFVYTFYKRNEDKMWVPLSAIRLGMQQQSQSSTMQATKQQKTDFFAKRTTK